MKYTNQARGLERTTCPVLGRPDPAGYPPVGPEYKAAGANIGHPNGERSAPAYDPNAGNFKLLIGQRQKPKSGRKRATLPSFWKRGRKAKKARKLEYRPGFLPGNEKAARKPGIVEYKSVLLSGRVKTAA